MNRRLYKISIFALAVVFIGCVIMVAVRWNDYQEGEKAYSEAVSLAGLPEFPAPAEVKASSPATTVSGEPENTSATNTGETEAPSAPPAPDPLCRSTSKHGFHCLAECKQ